MKKWIWRRGTNLAVLMIAATNSGSSGGKVAMKLGDNAKLSSARWQVPQVRPLPANVSFVPPEPMGRSSIYIREVGEATLVLELRDSITEAILARAVDRRAAESIGEFQKSNRAMNAASVRRLAGFWAVLLRERLDAYKEPQS